MHCKQFEQKLQCTDIWKWPRNSRDCPYFIVLLIVITLYVIKEQNASLWELKHWWCLRQLQAFHQNDTIWLRWIIRVKTKIQQIKQLISLQLRTIVLSLTVTGQAQNDARDTRAHMSVCWHMSKEAGAPARTQHGSESHTRRWTNSDWLLWRRWPQTDATQRVTPVAAWLTPWMLHYVQRYPLTECTRVLTLNQRHDAIVRVNGRGLCVRV